MSMRRRQRQNARAARRAGRAVSLNIVSLIDVFAILVFYLLVNTLTVDIPMPHALKLPESVVRKQPQTTVTVIVTKDSILVDNQPVMTTSQAMAAGEKPLSLLKTALLRVPFTPVAGTPGNTTGNAPSRGEINILADKSIPFRLVRRIMVTCSESQFARISLAVVEKKSGVGT